MQKAMVEKDILPPQKLPVIDLTNKPSGVYFLFVKTKDRFFSEKITKIGER